MEQVDITTQETEKIRQLPLEAQTALLAVANDWARKYELAEEGPDDNNYDSLLLELLNQRSQEAKDHPERLVDAFEFIDQRIQSYQ